MQSPAQMSHSFFGATVAVISYNPDAAKPNLYAIQLVYCFQQDQYSQKIQEFFE